MGLIGAIIGGVIGMSMGGPIGAIAGAGIGSYIGNKQAGAQRGQQQYGPNQQMQIENYSIVTGTILLGMEIAAADGHIDQVEVDQIRNLFIQTGISNDGLKFIDGVIDKYHTEKHSLPGMMDDLNSLMEYDDKLILIDFLYRIAAADEKVEQSEVSKINYYAEQLEVRASDVEVISNRYGSYKADVKSQSNITHCFNILKISPDADFDEVKSRYRKLVKKYHPDKFTSMGEEFAEIASIKFIEIQKAYETLEKHFQGK